MPRNRMIDTIGVINYLNATADMHNGVDGAAFENLLIEEPHKFDYEIADIMGVTATTIGTWKRKLKRDKRKAKRGQVMDNTS